jgi:hypothetical protein
MRCRRVRGFVAQPSISLSANSPDGSQTPQGAVPGASVTVVNLSTYVPGGSGAVAQIPPPYTCVDAYDHRTANPAPTRTRLSGSSEAPEPLRGRFNWR